MTTQDNADICPITIAGTKEGTWSAPWMMGRTHGTWWYDQRDGRIALGEGVPMHVKDMVTAAIGKTIAARKPALLHELADLLAKHGATLTTLVSDAGLVLLLPDADEIILSHGDGVTADDVRGKAHDLTPNYAP